ncbi:MAG: lytic transglycosylase domain-containing protein [Rhodospirillales bacterium]|nr:lytic transglycosylase domain-containing protein [Rhodospirillales bacterium]
MSRPTSFGRHACGVLGVLALCGATPAIAAAPPPAAQCDAAIQAAARTSGNPLPLMRAIAQVESGRPDSLNGALRPWPWTINAEGKGMFFDSKAAAIATVRTLQASGVRSIDVGCMQVNLMHHPDAFASLDEAFDPQRNAQYAGGFLRRLFAQTRDWMSAAGAYHSSTPGLATDYVKQVAAALGTTPLRGRLAGGGVPASTGAPTRPVAPTLARDGTIVPSVRLDATGQIRPRAPNAPAVVGPAGHPAGGRMLTVAMLRNGGS